MRLLALFIALLPVVALAQAAPPTDQEIAAKIVQESRATYYATGHPCACPEDRAHNGSRCGGRSAYSRPGGASPKCYVSDVTSSEIEAYRKRVRHRGAKGVALQHPSWGGADTGWAPMPVGQMASMPPE